MKKKWYKNKSLVRKIICIVVNLLAPFVFWVAGKGMFLDAPHMYTWMIIGHMVFIATSLIIYYLALIANAVDKMARDAEEDRD